MRRLALFVTLAALATLIVFEAPSAEAYNGAPWFKPSTPYSSDFADPSVVRDGNTYYAFATSTGGAYLPVMTSNDLSTWIAHPAYQQPACVGGTDDPFFNDAFPCPPAWGEDRPVGGRLKKELWAPGPAHIGSNWMVFYSMRVSTNPDRFCIGRAASSSGPLGPYVDNSALPFVCDSDPVGSIDPQPFIDDDGTPYLIWKSEGVPLPCNPGECAPQRIWSQQLTADGSAFAPGTAPTELMAANWPNGESTWENTVAETPAMGHFEGHYLLFYSGNIWHSTAYGIGYADCSGPLGPCTKMTPNAPVRGSDGTTENGPGAATPFLDASGQLQLAYDYWNPPYSDYPTDPGCDGTDPDTGAPYCVSQGQRRMKILPVYLTGSAVQIGGTPPVRAVARATDDSCPPGQVPPAGFTDIPSGDVHAASIDCVVWWKVANGTGDGTTYSPTATVIRGQMASFIARMLDKTSCTLLPASRDYFPDDNGTVYEADINRLAQAGIVGGHPDGTYGPNGPVSRAQMATFLVHAYEHCGTALSATRDWFPDDNGNTHEANINKAAEAGFAGGRADGTYAPVNPVARDQMASFLARVLDLLVENGRAHTPA
jgi:hypothetical protein